MNKSNLQIYENISVLVTGHTGFKGAWLVAWLNKLNAKVSGFALPPEPVDINLFDEASIAEISETVFGDVREFEAVLKTLKEKQPTIIFHLAAQSLVLRSYTDPLGTYATNVMGTAHILEAARRVPSVRAVVIVTSDKCYENMGAQKLFSEDDPMGGYDPYSSSKGCAELLTSAYRRSYFSDGALIASARAGNVIGGGDWSEDRLIPDIVKAIDADQPIMLRNPGSTRPWQHVLEPLRGYLVLGSRLLEGDKNCAGGWNFGPIQDDAISVGNLAEKIISIWGKGHIQICQQADTLVEAINLDLDTSKARRKLGFEPVISIDHAIQLTVDWYRQFRVKSKSAHRLISDQIDVATSLIG
jgi:CDP-glucose 4,6-dehydratase